MYMLTQISFTTQKDLKNKAMQKAKMEGLTLKAVLIAAMEGFVDSRIKFGILPEIEPEVEEMHFEDAEILSASEKLVKLLRKKC
jgi:hypothetical protein